MKGCSVAGCERKFYAKDMCNFHWQRARAGIDLNTAPRTSAGEGNFRPDGYHLIQRNGRRVYAHIAIAERALGRPLPKGAEVHHVNGNPSDNRPENLVICPDSAYHKLLHLRQRALDACGHPDWRICVYCGIHSAEAEMVTHGPRSFRHRGCSHRNSKRTA